MFVIHAFKRLPDDVYQLSISGYDTARIDSIKSTPEDTSLCNFLLASEIALLTR